MMITVLADDITGAAEIAGIAKSYGMRTSLEIGSFKGMDADVTVIATDTRSGTVNEARRQVESICTEIRLKKEAERGKSIMLFKKTDSALRGNIGTELLAAMQTLGYSHALLLAQNPSKERIIKNGIYFINGKRLDETMFRYDPEFPATSAEARSLIKGCKCRNLLIGDNLPTESGTVIVADASSFSEICLQLNKADKQTLIAGGADCFRAVLQSTAGGKTTTADGKMTDEQKAAPCCNELHDNGKRQKTIVVCGSTQSRAIATPEALRAMNAIEYNMPNSVFEGASPDEWFRQMATGYQRADMLIMKVGEHEFKGADYARRIKAVMAKGAKALIDKKCPDRLVIEGGATAFATLSSVGWTDFEVVREYAPGVVGMNHAATEVVLKPGSYPWGGFFS